MKPDDGASPPADRAMAADSVPPRTRRAGGPLRAGLRRAGALVGVAFAAFLALALATLLALMIVRLGADWIDGAGLWGQERPRLHPRQFAHRELALDVVRQILLAALVLGVVRWQEGPRWREALALAKDPAEPDGRRGLSPAGLGLILLLWPLVHITWVTGSAELLRMPVSRHGTLSPALSAGAAAAWFAHVLLLAPLAEELLMRGALYARARRLLAPAGAVGMTSLLFCLAHLTPAGIARPVTLIPLALMLGWLRWRSGRLWPCILLHAWSNLAMIAYVLWPAGG